MEYFYNIFKKFKIVGCCDNCKKYLFASSNFLYIENMTNLSLCLQYCSTKCLEEHENKYDYIRLLVFKYNDDSNSYISKSTFINNLRFIIKYPYIINFNSVELLQYIVQLRSDFDISKKQLIFLEDVKKYDIA